MAAKESERDQMRKAILRSMISAADCRDYAAPNLAKRLQAVSEASGLRREFYRLYGEEVTNYL